MLIAITLILESVSEGFWVPEAWQNEIEDYIYILNSNKQDSLNLVLLDLCALIGILVFKTYTELGVCS